MKERYSNYNNYKEFTRLKRAAILFLSRNEEVPEELTDRLLFLDRKLAYDNKFWRRNFR